MRIRRAVLITAAIMITSGSYLSAEENAAELNKRAVAELRAGRFDKAIGLYEKALKTASLRKDKTTALLGLSSSYLEKGIEPFTAKSDKTFYDKSLAYSMECLKLTPNQWQALGNIATVFMNTDNLEKSDYYYKEAEKYADKNSPFYKQLVSQHKHVKDVLKLRKKKE